MWRGSRPRAPVARVGCSRISNSLASSACPRAAPLEATREGEAELFWCFRALHLNEAPYIGLVPMCQYENIFPK